VISVLQALKLDTTLSITSIPEEYREIVAAQEVIGWDNFLMGLWANQWRCQLKAERLQNKGIFRLPERAIAAMIAKLWEIGWHLWLGRNASIYPAEDVNAEGGGCYA